MKNILFVCLLMTCLAGCKKDGDGRGKIANTIWSGVYKSIVEGNQPFVLEFTSDSTLEFHDKSGVEKGNCYYDKAEKTVTMDLQVSRVHFKASISDSNTFQNISNYSLFSDLERCERNTTTEQKLTGVEYFGTLVEPGVQANLKFKFTGETNAQFEVNGNGYAPVIAVERRRGTLLISFPYMSSARTFFGVIEGNTINAVTATGKLFLQKQ